jgi:hypothetical protein
VPRRSRSSKVSRRLFIDPSGQTEIFEKSVEQEILETRPVECLGQVFPNDTARREHFLQLLREKLKDPEFRKIEGFPIGEDEDILRMSDPPYYTACPNPFLEDFVRCYGHPYNATEPYHREPFAVDVSVGKSDPLYKAHGYHTKVPHLAIVPSILHYTKPGDVVLDGFCGSGMTGVAGQWCGAAPAAYRRELELRWKTEGRPRPEWGARRVILNDLGPAATFISAGYNLPFDVRAFEKEAARLLDDVKADLGWMYETNHKGGKKGQINFTVWSEVFSCPECAGEVVFVEEALNKKTKKTRESFPCPSCKATLNKDRLQHVFEARIDQATKRPWKRIRFVPVLINYSVGKKKYEKTPDDDDRAILRRIEELPLPVEMPTTKFPLAEMYHGSRLGPKGIEAVHHLFLPRPAQVLSALWGRARQVASPDTRRMMLFFLEQGLWTLSLLNRYRPTGYSQVNQFLSGLYYVPSQHAEASPSYVFDGKLSRLGKALSSTHASHVVCIETTTCAALLAPTSTIDYIFTDPPFGENIPYADLNFLVESWHGVYTSTKPEAIVDVAKKKGLHEYQDLMRQCFEEYYRVLKPSRWMTVVFSNSSNAVWRAIQEALGRAGFVVADVRTLDKEQGSYRQVTSSAVKQDLVISAYKPTARLEEKFKLGAASVEGAWAFVLEHLGNVPVFVGSKDKAEIVVERTPQMLHDRMIAYHVQRGLEVPIGTAEFLAGLKERFPDRDGMCFLPQQVAEYDRKRMSAGALKQLELSVNDERSAITWLRNELSEKPRSFQDLQPAFMMELQAWARHERTVELKEILAQNFLCYEERAPVPSQIHSYLSSNFKECRKLDKNDSALKERASDRWYVPDPAKLGDLEKLRDRALLKEFEAYRTSKERKLRVFRTEAIRAGFKAAWNAKDYQLIVDVAEKLPEAVIQEDEYLLQYFDNAKTRLGD